MYVCMYINYQMDEDVIVTQLETTVTIGEWSLGGGAKP